MHAHRPSRSAKGGSRAASGIDLAAIVDPAERSMNWSVRPDGTMERFSADWHKFTGLDAMRSSGFRWQKAIHVDDVLPFLIRWARARRLGIPFEGACRLRRACDGRYGWFHVRSLPQRKDGMIMRW